MNGHELFDQLVESINWSAYTTSSGNAAQVGQNLKRLVCSESPEAASNNYWTIENVVMVQGRVYSSGGPVLSTCFFALSVLELPTYVQCMLLEIVFWVVSGVPAYGDATCDGTTVDVVCRAEVQKGLWLLYRLINGPHRSAALEILELCETDPWRLRMVRSMRESDPDATAVTD